MNCEEIQARIKALDDEIDRLMTRRRKDHDKGRPDTEVYIYMAMCRERARLKRLLEGR